MRKSHYVCHGLKSRSVRTLIEQIQLISRKGLDVIGDDAVKSLIQGNSLEQGQAQDL